MVISGIRFPGVTVIGQFVSAAAVLFVIAYSAAASAQEAGPLVPPGAAEQVNRTVETTTINAADPADQTNALFGHNLIINDSPGLPSRIIFTFQGGKPQIVRALIVLDERLLIVPLTYREQTKDFRGLFPTPQTSLQYQFQVLPADGKALMSNVFYRQCTVCCKQRRTAPAASC